jgi:N-ethylmaleimide reductase
VTGGAPGRGGDLFSPVTLGPLALPTRIVMAPMTRLRADVDGTPTPMMARYYAQRASAGLIVTEGIWPHSSGQSEWRVPGLQTDAHVAGWRAVTDAVHAAGGRIVAQLMHGGRKGHPGARVDGTRPAGPSSVRDEERVRLPSGEKVRPALPREMSLRDVHRAVDLFAAAARHAVDAGFDAVEIHGANSYLVHQFLADNTNRRTDAYGGNVAKRIRFALEVAAAVAAEIGADRTAIRLSPNNPQSGMVEDDPAAVYRPLVERLDELGLCYLHLVDNDDYPALADLGPRWSGPLVANVGENRPPTTRETAQAVLDGGLADAVSFGRGFLANPDLPARLARSAPWNPLDRTLLYGPDERGYTDYSVLDGSVLDDGD